MKKSITILGLLIFLSCKTEKNREEILYYPMESEFANESFLIPINLDSTRLNYGDLLQMTPGNDYRKEVPFFEIKEGNTTKNIVPYLLTNFHNKRKDLITIINDSVFADKPYSIKDLKLAIKNSIQKQKQSDLKHRNGTLLAEVVVDMKRNSTGKDLKKILVKTTNAFEKVKRTESDSLFLYIYFGFSQSLNMD